MKIMASRTAIPMVTALKVPSPLMWLSVLGRLKTKHMIAEMALKTTVHCEPFVNVLRSLAPTMQCRAEAWE